MNDPEGRVEVSILGQRLVLKAGAEPAHIERLAAHVQAKIDEIHAGATMGATKLAVLAALNIADDYFRSTEEARTFKAEVAQRSRGLLRDLEEPAETP